MLTKYVHMLSCDYMLHIGSFQHQLLSALAVAFLDLCNVYTAAISCGTGGKQLDMGGTSLVEMHTPYLHLDPSNPCVVLQVSAYQSAKSADTLVENAKNGDGYTSPWCPSSAP